MTSYDRDALGRELQARIDSPPTTTKEEHMPDTGRPMERVTADQVHAGDVIARTRTGERLRVVTTQRSARTVTIVVREMHGQAQDALRPRHATKLWRVKLYNPAPTTGGAIMPEATPTPDPAVSLDDLDKVAKSAPKADTRTAVADAGPLHDEAAKAKAKAAREANPLVVCPGKGQKPAKQLGTRAVPKSKQSMTGTDNGPWGECPVCGAAKPLAKDGTIVRHRITTKRASDLGVQPYPKRVAKAKAGFRDADTIAEGFRDDKPAKPKASKPKATKPKVKPTATKPAADTAPVAKSKPVVKPRGRAVAGTRSLGGR